MGLLKNLSHKVDIYGLPLSFEEEDSNKIATCGGLVGSVITFSFVVAMSILFGKELIQRKHPLSITSEEHVDTSTVYLKEMPLLFKFIMDKGNSIDGNLYFNFAIYQYYTSAESVITFDTDLHFKPCDYRDYTKHQDWVKSMVEDPANKFLCISHKNDTKIVNPYGYPNSTFIHISFRKCNPKEKKCAADTEIALRDIYVQMFFKDAYIDVNNNSDPIKYADKIETSQNSLSFLKRNYIRFRKDVFIDDSGWLLENYKTTECISMADHYVDVNPNTADHIKDNLYWMTFESPSIRKKITRSYMKLQDLLAKIGGIVKGSVVIVEMLLIFYSKFKYSFFVIKCAINTEEDFKNLGIEQITLFSVLSKKLRSNSKEPKTGIINEIKQFDRQEIKEDLDLTPRNHSVKPNKEISKLDSNSIQKEKNVNKEKKKDDSNQESLDYKNKSDLRMLNIQKNNFINTERKNLEALENKNKNGSVKKNNITHNHSNLPSTILKEEEIKIRNEFKKMTSEVNSLDSYWLFVWSFLCRDTKKLKLYNKYSILFSKLISFRKMIKIRSKVNNDSEIVNKSDL